MRVRARVWVRARVGVGVRVRARVRVGALLEDRARLRREELGEQLGLLAVDRAVAARLGERRRLGRVLELDEDRVRVS